LNPSNLSNPSNPRRWFPVAPNRDTRRSRLRSAR
jgi:hypothetical protein